MGKVSIKVTTIDQPENEIYRVDVSSFVNDVRDEDSVSFLIADTEGQNGNITVYSKEEANESRWPILTLEKNN